MVVDRLVVAILLAPRCGVGEVELRLDRQLPVLAQGFRLVVASLPMLSPSSDFFFHVPCHVVVDRLVVAVLLVPPYRIGEVGIRKNHQQLPAVHNVFPVVVVRMVCLAVVVALKSWWRSRRRGVEVVVVATPSS